MACEEISATEAVEIGLINKAVPVKQLDNEVMTLVKRLKKVSPEAMALTKLAMNKVWETDLNSGLSYEIEAETVAMSCDNFFEGIKATTQEDREPVFKNVARITSGSEWPPKY